MTHRYRCILFFVLFALTACNTKIPDDTLVLTQTPLTPANLSITDILDQRYPPGTRLVLLPPNAKPSEARVLSKGLYAASAPVVCPSGDCIYFAGKAAANTSWQIYQVKAGGGQPKAVTSMPGGAMDPAIISTGELVFSSPVPKIGETWNTRNPAALYAQAPGGKPRRLTFGPTSAVAPTVLRDGRILFISARPEPVRRKPRKPSSVRLMMDSILPPDLGLFTVNNDGTEVTAFAVNHDGAPFIRRPRELFDGRVGFLASTSTAARAEISAEAVRTARPFSSRRPLFPFLVTHCLAVEPEPAGTLLVCLETQGLMGRSMHGNYAVYRLTPGAKLVGEPLFDDPAWNEVEAVPLAAHPNPMGHVTAIMPAKKYGTILCLDANFTRQTAPVAGGADGSTPAFPLSPSDGERAGVRGLRQAAVVRIFTREKVVGEVSLQPDGSFMAQVPAEVPLGFETLDTQGKVLQRAEPFLWVHPGENRSCIGCHEPYNRTLRNLRPLAASLPPALLQKGGS